MGGDQDSSKRETTDDLDPGDRGHGETSVVVDDPIHPIDKSRVSSYSSSGDCLHGRLTGGLGHSVSGRVVERSLATSGSAYQLARAPDSIDSSTTPTYQVTKQAISVPDRQLNGSVAFEEAGGGQGLGLSSS